MNKFDEYKERYFKQLDMFMPIVEKVHGPHHSEIFEVSKIYDEIKGKLNNGDNNLKDSFLKLRKVTDNYKIPDDVCESYEGIYKMLEELDKAYEGK